MHKTLVRFKNLIKRKHILGMVLGIACLFAAFFVLHMNDYQRDPTFAGSLCNQKMTAAINNAFGMNAGNDIIARMARGDEKSAYVSIWNNGWTEVHVESCDRIEIIDE